MTFENFPYCCTATIMCGFDDSIVYKEGDDEESLWDELDEKATYNDMIFEILTYCVHYAQLALLVAITIPDQPIIEDVLTNLGFSGTEHFEKIQHEDTEVKLWWGHIPTLIEKNAELIKSLGIVAKPKRRTQYGYEDDPY